MYKRQIHNQLVDKNFSKSMRKWKLPKLDRTDNKMVCHNLRRSLKHWSTPEMEIQNKRSIITKEVQLTTSLINQNVVNEAVMEANEQMIVEELWYETEETYVTRKQIVLHAKVIRTTSAEVTMDHGKQNEDEHAEKWD